jgi:hypothetical protein
MLEQIWAGAPPGREAAMRNEAMRELAHCPLTSVDLGDPHSARSLLTGSVKAECRTVSPDGYEPVGPQWNSPAKPMC